jgi:CSLREA domain-containing protein
MINFEQAWALTFTVTSTADSTDANVGDGTCLAVGGGCTLRAAVQEANANPAADVIQLPAGTYAITLAPQGDNGDSCPYHHLRCSRTAGVRYRWR